MYTKNSWEDGDVIEAKKLNHMEDGIKQNADTLETKADANKVLTDAKTVSGVSLVKDSVMTVPDGGGRNLLTGTTVPLSFVGSDSENSVTDGYCFCGGTLGKTLPKATTHVTVSFDYSIAGELSGTMNTQGSNEPWGSLGKFMKLSDLGASGRFTITIKAGKGWQDAPAQLFNFRTDNVSHATKITISNVMFETGPVAHDWVPAVEDMISATGDQVISGKKTFNAPIGIPAGFYTSNITENRDLNDFTQTGFYICGSNNTSKTLKNAPWAGMFFLQVVASDAPDNKWLMGMQKVWAFNGERAPKLRYITSSGDGLTHNWSAWSDEYAGTYQAKGNYVSHTGTRYLTDTDNLDDLTTPGTYLVNGTRPKNFPDNTRATWSSVFVSRALPSVVIQVVITNFQRTYMRVKSGSPATWDLWHGLVRSDDITNMVTMDQLRKILAGVAGAKFD